MKIKYRAKNEYENKKAYIEVWRPEWTALVPMIFISLVLTALIVSPSERGVIYGMFLGFGFTILIFCLIFFFVGNKVKKEVYYE